MSSLTLRSRPSTASSLRTGSETLSVASDTTASTATYIDSPRSSRDGKKKSSATGAMVTRILKTARSKSRLPKLSNLGTSDNAVPPVPSHPSPDYIPYYPPASPPANTTSKGSRFTRSKKALDQPPPVPSKDTEFELDKNLDDMDGIVDLNMHYQGLHEGVPDSPCSSGFESSVGSSTLSSDFASSSKHHHHHSSTSSLPNVPQFKDPFHHPPPSKSKRGRKMGAYEQIISPTTKGPFSSVPTLRDGLNNSPWMAPESWAVEKGLDAEMMSEEWSSDGEDVKKHRKKRNTMSGKPRSHDEEPYRLRIYRRDNTYHVATISLKTSVSDLIPYLSNKMLHDPAREMHRLYLKERGRGLFLIFSFRFVYSRCVDVDRKALGSHRKACEYRSSAVRTSRVR